MAEEAGIVWREYGALVFVECVTGDVKRGKLTSFPQSVRLKDDGTVVLSSIVDKSRAERDRINAQVLKDPRIAGMDLESMPFEDRCMFWSGFETVVNL